MLHRGLLLVAIVTGCGGGASPPPTAPAAKAATCDRAVDASSADAYTASFVRLLACDVPAAKSTVRGPLAVGLAHGGKTFEVSLERPWRSCQSDAPACSGLLAEHVSATVEALNPPPITAASLRLAVRSKEEIDSFIARGVALTAEPLVADLVVVTVVDTPATIKYMVAAELTALGMTPVEMTAQARRNTAAALGPLAAVTKDPPPDGLGMLYRNDPYEASRLIAHEEWRPVAEQFRRRAPGRGACPRPRPLRRRPAAAGPGHAGHDRGRRVRQGRAPAVDRRAALDGDRLGRRALVAISPRRARALPPARASRLDRVFSPRRARALH